MARLKAGIIGCGGRGNAHALGYSQSDHVNLVACADIHLPAARRMAERYGFERCYSDFREMLATEDLDVVSMALWPELHCAAVLDCVAADHPPRLINAEKPMAPTYGEAVRMHEACTEAGIMLTFSHQRRFGASFSTARNLLLKEAIGELQRMEMQCSNLFDWGTHWFDMMEFYNGDLQADWVMGQVDCAAEELVFGVQLETAGISYVKWPNGVSGLLTTGSGTNAPAPIRLVGSKGLIDVNHGRVRMLREGDTWAEVPADMEPVPGNDSTRYICDAVECLLAGRTSTLCSENALRATELIFATYESAQQRKRIVLPLRSRDSALRRMLGTGDLVIPDWPAFLTAEEEDDGFRLLFDGSTLDGWQSHPAGAWFVQGGILRARRAPATVCTTTAYGDVEFSCELRLRASRGRACLHLRTNASATPTDGLHIPIEDDRHEPPSSASSGSLNGCVEPAANPRAGASRWNWINVTCAGTRVSIAMNDTDLVDCDAADLPIGSVPACGHIAITAIEGDVDVRNVMIRHL